MRSESCFDVKMWKLWDFQWNKRVECVAAAGWPQNAGLENVETFWTGFQESVLDCELGLGKGLPRSPESQEHTFVAEPGFLLHNFFFFFSKSTSAKVRTQAVILVGIALHKTL